MWEGREKGLSSASAEVTHHFVTPKPRVSFCFPIQTEARIDPDLSSYPSSKTQIAAHGLTEAVSFSPFELTLNRFLLLATKWQKLSGKKLLILVA